MSSSNTTTRLRGERRLGRRLVGVAGPIVIGALVLGACGGSDDGATQSTIALSQESTAFVVRPPETTVAPTDTAPVEGGIATGAQEYTIQSGDYPLKVANQFGITVDELVAFNEWGSVDEFPFPGTVIQIPPGATVAGATTTTIATATPGGAASTTAPAATIPDAGDNCGAAEHTVVAGDIPIKLAEQYDVTLEALNAANASNPAYSQFIPGQTIIIPGKTDC
jgi:LysM repeat protein